MKHLKCILSGMAAGMCIGFGGGIFQVCMATMSASGGRVVGSLLFSVGLFLVCVLQVNLYTGKIGYVFENKKDYLVMLVEMLVGNAIGAIGLGYLVSATSLMGVLGDFPTKCAAGKILDFGNGGQKWYSCLINAFFCGVLVYLAVDIFKKAENYGIKIVGLVGCVTAFVALGFEHCVADMFYFGLANAWGTNFAQAISAMLLFILGNSLGSIGIWALLHFIRLPNKAEK